MKWCALLLMVMLSFSTYSQSSFEFVVIPDTQTYVEEFPDIYMKQMKWVASQGKRFSFVLHVGDITQNNSDEEWQIARKGLALLDGKVPYHLALGNHDMGSRPGKFADTRNSSLANRYFSYNNYAKNNNIIASFPANQIDNSCAEYVLIKLSWLVCSLEFGPRDKTIAWVKSVIKNHPQHRVIFNTHSYLYEDNTLQDGDDWYLPQGYGVGKEEGDEQVNHGGQLWNKLVKSTPHSIMVFSGHILGTGVGQLVNQNDNEKNVYQMLANYQKNVKGVERGDSGYLRIIKVDKAANTISVKTFSPWLNKYKTDPEHEFSFTEVDL
ncbi:metallophosphoesterase [Alteromonas ponticola]|uniref:Metallophosphatase n=1 Tax=Alteromonas ponticola TaxID=2720613 RepID=A0ABX1R8B8_9ALTE|nr:metallophosphoesterase [Alteromonas ponticola]NMH61495.1 metallophosphatase [Alteromonas ponticola]